MNDAVNAHEKRVSELLAKIENLEERLKEYMHEANVAFNSLDRINIAEKTISAVRHLDEHASDFLSGMADSAISSALKEIRDAFNDAWGKSGRMPF